MMAGTHMAAGLAVGYAAGVASGLPPTEILILCGVGALSALVPDVDHPNSALRRRTGVPGHLAFFWMKHRGITHTIPALVLVSIMSALLLPLVVAVVIAGGYASHLLLDAFTRSGVPLAWPLTWSSVRLLPRPLQVRTGSWREQAFLFGMLGALALGELARRGVFG
jgi:inner membrane protein